MTFPRMGTILLASSLVVGIAGAAETVAVKIDPSKTFQTMDGFGASTAFFEDRLARMQEPARSEVYDKIFKDLGATILRLRLYADFRRKPDIPYNWDCMADQRTIVKAALDRGVVNRLWAAAWSPPGWMKDSGEATRGGRLLPEHYTAYGEYLAEYAKGMDEKFGMKLDGISLFNEPGFVQSWETCEVTPGEYCDILSAVGVEFKTRGLTTKFFGPDAANLSSPKDGAVGGGFVKALLGNPVTAKYLSVVITHQYGDQSEGQDWPALRDLVKPSGKPVWETEMSRLGGAKHNIEDGVELANWIWRAVVLGDASCWHYWQYYWPRDEKAAQGLVVIENPTTYKIEKNYYCFKQWSKHVRPGAMRIEAGAPEGALRVAAFRDGGKIVVIAFNRSEKEIPAVFSGGMADGPVEGTRTTAAEDWEELKGLAVAGGKFKATIPAMSAQTFMAEAKER